MTDEPQAELDPRYSDPEATATPWSEVAAALDAGELWMISTVRSDGRPHTTPLLAIWDRGALHFTTGAEEQKHRNLEGNPACTLTTSNGRRTGGLDLVVEGSAERVTDQQRIAELAARWPQKYGPEWTFGVGDACFTHEEGGEANVFAVVPAKVLAFAKDPSAQTSYHF
jgi:nitroimidazol reductase NimA-like FMN-containing flavoprotein (pyridoxamine 5'-phosphate oxidase superfamily)